MFLSTILIATVAVLPALFIITYGYFQWSYQFWKRKGVLYLEPKFPFGNKVSFSRIKSIGDEIFEIVQRGKSKGWNYFGMFLSARPLFVPLNLELVKSILTKDFNHFTDRGVYYNEKDDPLSAHLFAIGGIKWKNLRAKLTPTFTSGKMRGMFQTLVDCGTVLENYLKQSDNLKSVNIKYVLACFSTDIIGSCAFGIECNSFKDSDSPFVRYGQKIFLRRKFDQLKGIAMGLFPNFCRAIHVKMIPTDVSAFFTDVVKTTVTHREQNNISRNDFLQLLIEIRNNSTGQEVEGDGTTLTMNEMIAQCFVFFLAGFETSSTTMTFALYEMSVNPEIQDRVREELHRVLKKYDNKICYDSLKELEYMQQVIDETLRKYPPLPFVTRKCVEDYTIPNTGITIDKGTGVLIPITNIHYDEDIYENPKEFNPERFTKENKQRRHPYAHIPFGEGPRICIGMRFGLMQTKVGLATILRNFRVKLNAKTKTPLEMDLKSFIPTAKGGMWLDLERL